MKRTIFTLAALGTLAGCGAVDPFQANAPTYDTVALSQSSADTATAVASAPAVSAALTASPTDCHPHLFARTIEVIQHVNRHFYKHVRHVEDLIKAHPVLAQGQTRTWESVKEGIDRKFTMTATPNADGSTTYAFELDVAAVVASGSPAFVKVMSGSITHIPGASDERKGSITFDFSALATVITTEKSTGQISDSFDILHDPVKGEKRSAAVTLTNFHFDDDAHGPRNGSYSWEREPGVGGKFQFTDSLVLLCPSNPNNLVADVVAVSRWYKAADGAVHGRSDAQATGGQIAAGNAWIGVTCAKGQTTSSPAEGYWLMKLEDSSGATVSAQADMTGLEPCDPVFGPVPLPGSNGSDYHFGAAVTFPNEW